jgi:hypothetical protein
MEDGVSRLLVVDSGNTISLRSTERPRELVVYLDPRPDHRRDVLVTPCEEGGVEHRCSKATPAQLLAWLVQGVDLPPHGCALFCRKPLEGKP